jgi:L-malate glycosyltransferase
MKVVHLIDSLRVGGAQTLLVTFARQAALAGKQTHIISLREREDSPMSRSLEALGAHITCLPRASLFDPRRFAHLLNALRVGKYTHIHAHLTYANILGIAAARWLGLPVVVSMHNVLHGRQHAGWSERLEHALLKLATRILAVGENVGADYRPLFGQKVVTLVNAVSEPAPLPAEARRALRAELTGDPNAPVLVAIGRLTEQKGFGDLIAAFAEICQTFPACHLIVAGDGRLRAELEAESAARGLNNLHWLGMRQDVPNLLTASDIYVSAAHWEGLSIALLEAMAAGLAVVATAVGDAPQVVTAESGALVPPHAPVELAAAVCALLANPAQMQALGNGARARIRAKYGAQAWYENLLAIYQSARP